MERFAALTAHDAPEGARPILVASEKQFGFLPSPVARAARSPALLKHLMASFAAFDRSSLSHVEREVVAMTVAYEVGCHYCMAMHSAMGAREFPEVVAALRAGGPLDNPRLEAVRSFARDVLLERGHVGEARWAAFLGAGLTEEHALDITLGVGVYVLSTFTNVLTDAPLDAPFRAFDWHRA